MNKMKYSILIVFCYLLSSSIAAQSNDSTSYSWNPKKQMSYKVKSDYNTQGAKKDIVNGNIRILFSGGFGGMPDFNNEDDLAFQKKYGVKFYSLGCFRGGDDENQEAYNNRIFKYLDEKFGKTWRIEIRKDAIGFKN